MKNKIAILAIAFLVVFAVNAQEKKIKFNKGTLKICSSKTFKIEGYNGAEVIIKSLHDKKNSFPIVTGIRNSSRSPKTTVKGVYSSSNKKNLTFTRARNLDSISTSYVFFSNREGARKKGLKRLGRKQENKDLVIYFTIEQKDGELIFKDATNGQFVMLSNESYLIKIPNSIKLNWDTSNCKKENKNKHFFYSNKTSSLSNFNGEVELTTSLSNFKLTDVTGPVSINSIGGNVTVAFDKKLPLKLYSIYSNNGFIDITMPQSSDVNVEANAAAVYSDINFKVLQDTELDGQQHMKLKLRRGKVKMKLEAGFGTVYLRKK
jgi:hypothetical protein